MLFHSIRCGLYACRMTCIGFGASGVLGFILGSFRIFLGSIYYIIRLTFFPFCIPCKIDDVNVRCFEGYCLVSYENNFSFFIFTI